MEGRLRLRCCTVALVLVLLAAGCGRQREEPLLVAADKGDQATVRALLENGADPNVRGPRAVAALYIAASRNDLSMAKLLLEYGADPNPIQGPHMTPLHMAVQMRKKELAEVLIAHGADVDAKEHRGMSPLALAILTGGADVAALLEAHGAKAAWGSTAPLRMQDVVGAGDVAAVQTLLDDGVDPNAPAREELTPLAVAALAHRPQVATLLLRHGADLNGADTSGMVPLHFAAQAGSKEVAEILLAHGADPNVATATGTTPLHLAALTGSTEVVGALLGHGAEINASDGSGVTPGAFAQAGGPSELVEMLAEHGAQVSWGNRPWAAIFEAVGRGDAVAVKSLLDAGTDPNVKGLHEATPLHVAVMVGEPEVAELLLEAGADPNAATFARPITGGCPSCPPPPRGSGAIGGGATPLHIAAHVGSKQLAELLLAYGADVDAHDTEENTPLAIARFEGHAGMLPLLGGDRVLEHVPLLPAQGAGEASELP